MFTVLRAIVIGRDEESAEQSTKGAILSHFIKYDILVTRVYKGLKNLSQYIPNTDYYVFKASVYSHPANSLSCGTRLEPHERLILSGNIRNGKLMIGFCDWKKRWSKKNDFLMKQVFGNTRLNDDDDDEDTLNKKNHP